MANEVTANFQTVSKGSTITLYACTSTTSDWNQYIDQPSSGTFKTYMVAADSDDMVFYYKTDGNGKKYVVGSEPKSIRHA